MTISRLAPLVLAAAVISPALAAAPIALTFPAPATNSIVKSNYLGLSIELSFYNVYFGNDTNSIPQPILNYFGAIRNHTGSLPVRMRLGGNSMDSSTYVSNQTDTMLYFTNPQANFNDQPVNFGPLLWDQMKAISNKLGGAEYVVGLSLLSPDDSRAANVPVMANDAKKALGEDLDVFLLGNEPDLYTGHFKRPQLNNYTVQNYFDDFKTASSGLGDMSNPPLIGGPTVCCAWDLANLVQSGFIDQFKNELKYFSVQHYPQNWCAPPKHAFDLPYYGQHSQAVTLANWNSPGLAMALKAGMTLMMSEFNSASCGGIPGISNTFLAGSLWTLDYALQLATVGFGAAYVHEREPGITYNIFEAPTGPAGSPGPWVTNPGMYSLLIAPQVLGSGSDSRIIDLNVAGSMFDDKQSSAGYATYDAATGAISRLALFNFQNVTGSTNPVQTFTIPAEVFTNSTTLKLPNADPTKVVVKFLTSTNTNEQYDISWAGKTYHNTGDGMMVDDTSGRPGTTTLDCSKGCSVDVPGPGMALVFVAPEAASANSSSDTKAGGSSTNSASGASETNSNSNTGKSGASMIERPVGLLATLVATALAFVAFA